jgi:beta-hydroxylase
MTTPTFLDPVRQRSFEDQGFVTFPLLEQDEVLALRAVFDRHHPQPGAGFSSDFEQVDAGVRRAIAADLTDFWSDQVDRVLVDHRVFMTSFLAKWPDESSQLDLHQDWTYVDERRFRSVAFWIALDDASEELGNGPLKVVPGSHRLVDALRGTWTPSWYEPLAPYLEPCAIPVPVRAGDAVVMDHRLLHYSPPNRSGSLRLALAGAAVPKAAGLLHPVDQGDGTVRVLAVDDDWFAAVSPAELWDQPPVGGTVLEVVPQRAEPVDLDRVVALCGPPMPQELVDASRQFADHDLGGSEPPEGGDGVLASALTRVLRANHRMVEQAAGDGPSGPTALADLPFLRDLESAYPDIREEWNAVAAEVELARMSDLAGAPLPVDGSWTALILRENRGWLKCNVERCPRTVAHLRSVPGLRAASFSVLGKGAEIHPHRGHNNGVLRIHLGVVVPGPPGACTLQAGGTWLHWTEGVAWAFDDTFEHRAFNRSSGPRVSLMLEVDRRLTGAAELVNRAVQPLLRLDPQVRGARRRVEKLDRVLNA